MKRFYVNGMFFSKDGNENLLVEFRVGGMVHQFKIPREDAMRMSDAIKKLYTSTN